jgi:HTH-like domain
LQINRAWYYARQRVTIEPSKRVEAVTLRDAIEQIILNFSGSGYRRVTHALQRAGWQVNHKRVLRIMREESRLVSSQTACACTPLIRTIRIRFIPIWSLAARLMPRM